MRPLQNLKKFQIVKPLLGFGWRIFIGLMGCGELRNKFFPYLRIREVLFLTHLILVYTPTQERLEALQVRKIVIYDMVLNISLMRFEVLLFKKLTHIHI